MKQSLFDAVSLGRGRPLANRFVLAPLTNQQSNDDGALSDDEFNWLLRRAEGGFALTMTCAAYVSDEGKGFPRQLGVSSDAHIAGLERLAKAVHAKGGLCGVQLQHSGARSLQALTGVAPAGAYDAPKVGGRAMSTGEVEQAVEDFILAGLRAQRAGMDCVELHAGHGYLLCQFLDVARNQRSDRYGGGAEGRARVLHEVIDGLRDRAGPDLQIGVRLSPERYGVDLGEMRALASDLMRGGKVDVVDVSCWDVFKQPEAEAYRGKPLMQHFTELERYDARLGVAGKIMDVQTARRCVEHGADFVLLGRAAILHHDFPRRALVDEAFQSAPRPVTAAYLRGEGLGDHFVAYLREWDGFVAQA